MEISIVIVAWNAKKYLELCLDSLLAAPSRRSMETIVVDNASSDGTSEMITTRFPWVKLIKSQENLGFSRGNNLGIRRARGRYIALVNPDVIVLPGCLDALADFLDRNPYVGNVGPRVLNPDMTLQSTCRRFPTLWNNFCSAMGLAARFKNSRILAGEHMFFFPHDRTLAVDVIVGCFSFIRREAFDDVGLLDEGLFMYGDDVDWCRRARKAGWQVVFYPGAQAIHDRGKITAPYPVRFALAQQRSVLYYWDKHHGLGGRLGIRGMMILQHVRRFAAAVASRATQSNSPVENEVRKKISSACLRELLGLRAPQTA
ncbi:MAG TPA: glycosyltransferase family 2 protein [Candidatus Eisenbacteria bacterium]|nr:glycosyltransferase family 2 protein [Candidatus Eisenbacteria bacterium]